MELSEMRSNSQAALIEAVRTDDIDLFRRALKHGANPNLPCGDSNFEHLSVFEQCCRKSDMALFIQECVRVQCDVNHINESLGCAPINLAALSGSFGNVKFLLVTGIVKVDHQYEGKTALVQLIANINDDNFRDHIEAMQILVVYKADAHIPDEHGTPPIQLLIKATHLRKEYQLCAIDMLCQQCYARLDSESEHFMQEHHPQWWKMARDISDDELWTRLNLGSEDSFVRGCNIRMKTLRSLNGFVYNTDTTADDTNPLRVAIQKGMVKVVDKLLVCSAQVGLAGDGYDAICDASAIGRHKVLQSVLTHINIRPAMAVSVSNAIATIIPKLGSYAGVDGGDDQRRCGDVDYQRCMDYLLRMPDIALQQLHANGNTVLHLAVQFRQRALIRELLRLGARMGVRNAGGSVAIADIDADVLADHLDDCISGSADLRPGEQQYELSLKFGNFQPSDRCGHSKHEQPMMMVNDNEMTSVEHMAVTPDLQHLVKHPLVASFMFLKWNRLLPTFYVKFTGYLLFFVSLIAYIMCRNYDANDVVQLLTGFAMLFGIVYMVLCETVNLIIAPGHFFRQMTTYTALLLTALALALLGYDVVVWWAQHEYCEECRRSVSAIVILLASTQFFVMLGSLPAMTMSMHLVMLLTVAKNFIKTLMLYSIILVAFALCFFTLFGRDRPQDHDDGNNTFTNFGSPWYAMLKSLVMLTGEFDTASIRFDYNLSYAVFVAFIILVSMVMNNLLTGLAVSDTQALQSDAELTYWMYQAKMLVRYEQILGKTHKGFKNGLLKKLLYEPIALFDDYLPCSSIIVLPNDGHRVKVPTGNAVDNNGSGGIEAYDLKMFSGRWAKLFACLGLSYFTGINLRTVSGARTIIEQRERELVMKATKREQDAASKLQLQSIEEKLGTLLVRVDVLLNGRDSKVL